MTYVYSLFLGIPPYVWLRRNNRYTKKAIIKTGIVIGAIIGLLVSVLTSQLGFMMVGTLFGLIGSLIFHFIHGDVAITKA
jgi:hypothetical protein